MREYSPADYAEAADKRQVEEMQQTTITAILAFLAEIKKIKEISCQRIQSQASLSYVERSRNSFSKNKRPNLAHVTEQAGTKTHLKVHGKRARKFPLSYVQRKLVYFAMTRKYLVSESRAKLA